MSLEDVREDLGSEDAEARREAVIALGREAGAQARALLLDALGDSDWRVRKEAVRVAREHAGRLELLSALVDAVGRADNVGRRNAALEVLDALGPAATAELLARWPGAPDAAKRFYVEALGHSADPRAVGVLAAAAKSADANVAAAALDALASIGGAESERALRDHLQSEDPFQRIAALDGLDRLGAVVPWDELAPLLSDRRLRRVALGALGRSGRAAAVPYLIEALADTSSHTVSAAATSLARLHGESASARAAMSDELPRVPERARSPLRALLIEGAIDARRAVGLLLLLARDVRALEGIVEVVATDALAPAAFDALHAWGAAASRPLLDVARESTASRRAIALELAADLAETAGGELAAEVLSELRVALGGREPDVAVAAARCMEPWARAADATMLLELAMSAPEALARAAGRALEALAKRDRRAVDEALDGLPPDGRSGAALTSLRASMGGPGAEAHLHGALVADDPSTRRAAIEGIATTIGPRGAELIGLSLADDNSEVQAVAAGVLGKLRDDAGRPVASDVLLLALDSRSSAVRAAAARSLGEARELRAVAPLRELARDRAAVVAREALRALRSIGDEALDDLLVDALGHPDSEVVKEGLRGLADHGGPRVVARLAIGLEHASWDVRVTAAELIARVDATDREAALRDRLSRETDATVRSVITRALEGAR